MNHEASNRSIIQSPDTKLFITVSTQLRKYMTNNRRVHFRQRFTNLKTMHKQQETLKKTQKNKLRTEFSDKALKSQSCRIEAENSCSKYSRTESKVTIRSIPSTFTAPSKCNRSLISALLACTLLYKNCSTSSYTPPPTWLDFSSRIAFIELSRPSDGIVFENKKSKLQ